MICCTTRNTTCVLLIAMLAVLLAPPLTLLAQETEGDSGAAKELETALPAVPPANPLKTRDELQAAYQKEYAFLEAQVRDLNTRTAEFESTAHAAEIAKQGLIDRIEGELIALQTRSDRIDDLLADAERQYTSVEDGRSMMESTFLQASVTLEPYGLKDLDTEKFQTLAQEVKIETLLNQVIELLARLGTLSQSSGAFFLKDGTEVSGTLIKVGNIAVYGVSGDQGGALAPAGDGRFKVWFSSTPATALALANGNPPAVLDMYVFESSEKAAEEAAVQSIPEHITAGGSIAWVIVGLGALAAVLIVLRTIFLRNASASTGEVSTEVGELVKRGQLHEALQVCKRLRGSSARVVAAAIRNLDKDRAHVEDIVSEQILHESTHLNRFGAFIMVIAGVAPLLGLLGTVTGMMSTFDIITEFGTGDPKLLSSGISVALITTEVGLEVAIPALVFGNLLSGWADTIKDGMEKAALHVMNLYLDRTGTSASTT